MVFNDFKCCCGPCKMHVESGSLVIAIAGCLVNIGHGIWEFCPTTETHSQNIASGVVYMLAALMYVSIVVAQQKRNHRFYLPYLIVLALGLIAAVLYIFVYIGFIIAAPQWVIDDINKAHPEFKMDAAKLRLLLGCNLIPFLFSLAFNSWFYLVIYKAYKYLKDGAVQSNPSV